MNELVQKQVQLYNDIIMIGNIGNFIIFSLKKEEEVQTALQNIFRLKKIDEDGFNRTREIMTDMRIFSASARSVYAKIGGHENYVFTSGERPREDLEGEILIIGQQTGRLRERVSSLSRYFSDELRGEVTNINRGTRHYRYLNLAIFLCVVSVVGMAVWIVISRSVSQAEKDLRKNKQMLERTINSLNEAVFIIDSESERIIDCNRAAEKIFGYDRSDIIGEKRQFLHLNAESFRKFEARLYPAVERNGFFEWHQYQMKAGDGRIFPTDHSVVPLTDNQGNRVACQETPDTFDLVITDMNMPDMTGMDLAPELIRCRREIPIILCTGFSEVVTKKKSEIIGISEFMMKPVIRRQMAETIRKVLENGGRRGNGPA